MRRREYKRGVILAVAGLVVAIYAGIYGTKSNINMSVVQNVLMMCITLGIPEALRRANAKSTSQTAVAGLSMTAFLVASLVTAVVFALSFMEHLVVPIHYTLTTGGVLVCVRCLVEYFCAMNDRTSALLTDILSAIAVAAPAIMGFSGDTLQAVLTVDAVLLIAMLVALSSGFKNVRKGERVMLEMSLFQEISSSFIRVVLYPALVALLWIGGEPVNMILPFCGLVLVESGRTTFRRDASESAGFIVNLCLLLMLASAASLPIPTFTPKMIFAAAFTLMVLYAHMNARTILMSLLMLAGTFMESGYASPFLDYRLAGMIAFGCAFTCLLLCIPEWAELFRRMKVRRIKRRAMKARKKHH